MNLKKNCGLQIKKLDIGMNGSKLQILKCFKYLGLILDQKLKWIDYIAHVELKVALGLGIINKAKPCFKIKCLRNFFCSFIYAYFTYCVEVCGNAAISHLLPLCLL